MPASDTSTAPALPVYAHAEDSTPLAKPLAPALTIGQLSDMLYNQGVRPSGAQLARVYVDLAPYLRGAVDCTPLDRETWCAALLLPGIDAARVAALRTYGQARGYLAPPSHKARAEAARDITPAHSDPLAQ